MLAQIAGEDVRFDDITLMTANAKDVVDEMRSNGSVDSYRESQAALKTVFGSLGDSDALKATMVENSGNSFFRYEVERIAQDNDKVSDALVAANTAIGDSTNLYKVDALI